MPGSEPQAAPVVLGIDPGVAATGYGIVTAQSLAPSLIEYGVLRTPTTLPLSQRLYLLHQELGKLIDRLHPSEAAVEQLFFRRNAKSAMAVGQARGVVLLALAEAGLAIAEYTPLQTKQAITDSGSAAKAQVQEMVRRLLGLRQRPPRDAADALAVALCHVQHQAFASHLVTSTME
ncbi:MAG: crossover junction endodeoxyribonuclease RuvC [Chloroflexi bacterium]|nr:crossover junction endodeoxyribonuclease RuvC [Chloroflexota bacterium]